MENQALKDINTTIPAQVQVEKPLIDHKILARTQKLEQKIKPQREFTIESTALEPIPEQQQNNQQASVVAPKPQVLQVKTQAQPQQQP